VRRERIQKAFDAFFVGGPKRLELVLFTLYLKQRADKAQRGVDDKASVIKGDSGNSNSNSSASGDGSSG
jgi:hypothetical protein